MSCFSRFTAFVATVTVAAAGLVAPAAAAPSPKPPAPSSGSVQRLIDTKLALTPGGRQIGPDKVVWDKLGMSAEFGAAGVSSCQYEYLCLYGDSDYNDGPDVTPWKLNFWKCNVLIDLRSGGFANQTSSLVNNQTYGTVGYLYHWNGSSSSTPELIWIGGTGNPIPLLARNDDADLVEACR